MTEPRVSRLSLPGRLLPLVSVLVLVIGAVVTALRFGAPAVVLWFAFATLAGAILLFWESLRTALDPDVSGDETTVEVVAAVLGDLEARKRAALRALKDIEFEHSIHRLSDEDYVVLRDRYRAEARAAIEAMDKGLGVYLSRAAVLIDQVVSGQGQLKGTPAGQGSRQNRRKVPSVPPTQSMQPMQGVADVSASSDTAEGAHGKGEPGNPEGATRVCAGCQTRNETDAVFCKRCGVRLQAAEG